MMREKLTVDEGIYYTITHYKNSPFTNLVAINEMNTCTYPKFEERIVIQ